MDDKRGPGEECCQEYPALLGIERTQVIRTADYNARLLDALSTGRGCYRAISGMEKALIAANGYPPGSFSVAEKLRLIAEAEWQGLIAAFENIEPGAAYLALKYIEQQRAFRAGDITLFYAVLTLTRRQRIILLDLDFSAAPTWGEVMKRIYDLTKVR